MAEPPCLSCAIVSGRSTPVVSPIVETAYFHAHQDVAYPIPGQVIVAARRHVKCLDELSASEAEELLPLMVRIRRVQRSELGIEHTYYFYNEDTMHHFHVWMVPCYEWMKQFGRSIEAVRPALVHARDTIRSPQLVAEVESAANRLRRALAR